MRRLFQTAALLTLFITPQLQARHAEDFNLRTVLRLAYQIADEAERMSYGYPGSRRYFERSSNGIEIESHGRDFYANAERVHQAASDLYHYTRRLLSRGSYPYNERRLDSNIVIERHDSGIEGQFGFLVNQLMEDYDDLRMSANGRSIYRVQRPFSILMRTLQIYEY